MYGIQRLMMLHRLMDKAGDGDGGGSDGGDSVAAAAKAAADVAAAEAAAKAATEAADAEKKKKGDKPSDSEAALLKEVMEKKEELKKTKEKLKAFEGLDPAAIKELLKQQETAAAKAKADAQAALEKAGEYETVKKQMIEAHTAEVTNLKKQIEEISATANKRANEIDDLTIGLTFNSSQFIKENLVLTPSKARVVYGNHFERDEAGNIVGYDKPKGAASRAPLVDGTGNPLTFDVALQKLIDKDPEKDHLIRSKVQPGAGSDTGNKNKGDKSGKQGGDDSVVGQSRILSGLKAGMLKAGKELKIG
jgi:hypothetical protein